jgi:hypothetical protein
MTASSGNRIPLWLKVMVTAWVAVVVARYAVAAPPGLLWFCVVALLLTTVGLWLENRLLISIPAVGSICWTLLWNVDLLTHLVTGIKETPIPLGQATYMFNAEWPLQDRLLSLYHGWLPFVLLFALKRLGYDGRALFIQIALTCVLILAAYLLVSDLNTPAGNVNVVFGLSDKEPQRWVGRGTWLIIVMLYCPIAWYIPTHFALRWLFRREKGVTAFSENKHQ